jgi:hypothetical protein
VCLAEINEFCNVESFWLYLKKTRNYSVCRFLEARCLSTAVTDNPPKLNPTEASVIDKGPCTYSSDLVETLSLSL